MRDTLTGHSWAEFVRSSWGRSVVHWTSPLGSPLLRPEWLFEALLRAREVGAHSSFFLNWELSPGHYSVQGGRLIPEGFLPESSDRTLEQYGSRLAAQLEQRRYCLRLPSVQLYSERLAEGVRRFLSGLEGQLSAKVEANAVLLLGDYTMTPIGVHADPVPIFQLVVAGQRRAYFWTKEAWLQHIESLASHDPSSDAHVVELAHGDVVYWPEGHFHVFGSVGFSAAVSVYMTITSSI